MNAVCDDVTPDVKERRKAQLDAMLKEARVFARKATVPEDRIALAEIERELLDMQTRWRDAGLLPEPPLPLETTNGA